MLCLTAWEEGRQSSEPAYRFGLVRFETSAAMHPGVACCAERDQVILGVGSGMAAERPVVHFKIRHRAAGLAPPAIATQDLLAQIFV